jgi:hypothetical protein
MARPPEAYTGSLANAKMSTFRAYRVRAATIASGQRCRFLSAAAPSVGANRKVPDHGMDSQIADIPLPE